jgi:hypothetical protein
VRKHRGRGKKKRKTTRRDTTITRNKGNMPDAFLLVFQLEILTDGEGETKSEISPFPYVMGRRKSIPPNVGPIFGTKNFEIQFRFFDFFMIFRVVFFLQFTFLISNTNPSSKPNLQAIFP